MHHRVARSKRSAPLELPHYRRSNPTSAPAKSSQRQRKLSLNQFHTIVITALVTAIVILIIVWIILLRQSHRGGNYPQVEQYREIYERAWRGNTSGTIADQSNSIKSSSSTDAEELLTATYGPELTNECHITALLLDPRLGDMNYASNQPIWFALESFAVFGPAQSCIFLATSYCDDEDPSAVRRSIYERALPHFRRKMEEGRVRVSFLEHTKYHLHSCRDFGNPTSALINWKFWEEEFIDLDGDWIWMLQEDSVLCRPWDDTWEEYFPFAYTGAIWPRAATKLTPVPPQGMCMAMPAFWRSWHLPLRRRGEFPPPFPESFCRDGVAPLGNGGFSLRRRQWMQKVIEYCPHHKYSGLDSATLDQVDCKVMDQVNEDVYFGTLLRGIGAPLPNAVQAALFSIEMYWPEDALQVYGKDTNNSSTWDAPKLLYRGTQLSVPLGVHKPWWYQPNDLLQSRAMGYECPYLKYIFEPSMSRWHEFKAETKWAGIGT